MEVRFVVEPEAGDAVFIFADGELSHAEVRGDGIGDESVRVDGGDAQVVEVRRLRRPQLRTLHRDGQRCIRFAFGFFDDPAVLHHFDGNSGGVRRDGDGHGFGVDVRHDVQVLHIAFAHALEPHGAPDAGLSRVPDVPRFRDLFPSGDVRRVRRIEYLERQHVFAFVQTVGDIEGEGEEASFMGAKALPVETDFTVVVDCREVQERDVAEELPFHTELFLIVERVLRRDRLFHTGQLCLGREGDKDVALVVLELRELRQDGILPRAVEAQVTVTLHLRTRILRQRHDVNVFRIFGIEFHCHFSFRAQNAANLLLFYSTGGKSPNYFEST